MVIDFSDPLLQAIALGVVLIALLYYATRRPPQPAVKTFKSSFTPGPAEEPSKTRVFSREELATYTGANKKRIYIGSKGRVYDVSDSGFYEPGSTYGKAFAGRDASIDLATMDVEKRHEVTAESVKELTASQMTVLTQWDDKFATKYEIMGVIENSPFLVGNADKKE